MHKQLPVGCLLLRFCSRSLFLLVALFVTGQLMAQALSGAYTINKTQAVGGRNFQTFQQVSIALEKGISAPVTFTIPAGSADFEEQVSFYFVNGASATNTITFNCNGATLKYRSTDEFNCSGLKLDGARHYIFDNLVVKPTVIDDNDRGIGIHLLRDADSNIIRKCTITIVDNPAITATERFYGLVVNGSDDKGGLVYSRCDENLITENTITGGDIGIFVSSWITSPPGVDYTQTAKNNKLTKNVIKNFRTNGILLEQTSGTLVQGNTVGGVSKSDAVAIAVNQYSTKASVLENKIIDFSGAAGVSQLTGFGVVESVNAAPGTEILIANNIISMPNANTAFRAFDASYSSRYINFYHNTVSVNGTGGGEANGIYFDNYNALPAFVNFVNNIISFSGNFSTVYAVRGTGNNAIGNVVINRNNYYFTGTGNLRVARYPNGSTYNTLDAWRTGSKNDLLTTQFNPLFENVSTGLLKPTEKLLDNRAAYVNIATDIAGVNRSNTFPDPGAYEFATIPCSLPVATGTTAVLPGTKFCEQTTISMDLTGNTAGDQQTYQWMSSTTETGTYTNIGTAQKSPAIEVTAATTLYFKAAVTCGTDTKMSNPVLVTVDPRLPAGTYTINAKAAAGTGNFTSFANAIQAMSCGIRGAVVFNVVTGSGPYSESVTIPYIANVSATNTITFNGNGETLTFAGTAAATRNTLTLSGARFVTVYGLKIVNTGITHAVGVQIYNDADSNVVRKCEITVPMGTANTIAGVAISGNPSSPTSALAGSTAPFADVNWIDSCTITGGYYGIVSYTAEATPMYDNIFSNNKIVDFGVWGINASAHKRLRVMNNDLSRPTNTMSSQNIYGIDARFSQGLEIFGNKVHNLGDAIATINRDIYGINIQAADAVATAPNKVYNNTVYGIKSGGNQWGIQNSGSDYTLFYHNTIVMDDSRSQASRYSYVCNITGSMVGAEVKNNILILNRNAGALSYALLMPTSGVVSNNNDLVIGTNAFHRTGNFGGTQYTTFDNWKGSGQDANSLSIEPAFVNVATGNLKPTATALMNKGVNVSVIRDILLTKRNTTKPDMGAYEFGCAAFPADAVVDKTKVQICAGGTASFSIPTPVTGVTYNWYDKQYLPDFTEGTVLKTGTPFQTAAVNANTTYYVETTAADGCGSGVRIPVSVEVLEKLKTAPVVKTAAVTGETARFVWEAVPGATGYLVSRDRNNFTTPSSGAAGLSHTVSGLNGGDTLSLVVKATATLECQSIVSDSAFARTLTYTFFVPNMFTPNGDGKNDEFRVYGNTIQSLKLMIFNQWGEKVFEGSDKLQGWKGVFKGQPQPVGVYIYVATMTFTNGSVQTTKGTLSLIR